MCGRYTLKNKNEIKDLYGIDIKPNFNITPSSNVLVLSDGPRMMKWSYSPSWAKVPMNIINVRVETLNEKPSFDEARRCIFIMDGWYEWKRWFDWKRRENKKVPYYNNNKGEVFHIGGICNDYGCAIVTQKSVGILKQIHYRQPLLLKDSEINLWLKGDVIANSDLMNQIQTYEVSTYVNSSKNNSEKCIEKKLC
tara:strand:- start:92 stop:676 length:585 start_codon:yes stop_codon:yes gene_type:complete